VHSENPRWTRRFHCELVEFTIGYSEVWLGSISLTNHIVWLILDHLSFAPAHRCNHAPTSKCRVIFAKLTHFTQRPKNKRRTSPPQANAPIAGGCRPLKFYSGMIFRLLLPRGVCSKFSPFVFNFFNIQQGHCII